MQIRRYAIALALALTAAHPALHAQALPGSAAAPAARGPSFSIDIRAPSTVRPLLERHLELQRYREVDDLDDAELARLAEMATRNARDLVGTLGFFDPRISVRREQLPGARPVIVLEVDPGEPATVTGVAVDFEGDIAQSPDPAAVEQRRDIRSNWSLPTGRRFTQSGWDTAKADALLQLTIQRYPAGRVSYSLADVDAQARQVRLGIRLDSGPLFRLGPMQVTGTERYDALLVPRLARLPQGSIYDQRDITEAQLRLTGSGYYDSAFIFVDPQADPNAAPVQVTVREAAQHKVVLGVGVSTDSGPRASVEYRNNRVPGIGWRADTKLQIERKAPFAETEWTATPDEKGWRWGVLGRAERLDDDELLTQAQRLRAGRSRAGNHIDRNVYVQYERASVREKPTATPGRAADIGDGAAISVNYAWTGRYFDGRPLPTAGFGVGFELGAGLTLTGEKSPFQRTLVRGMGIYPLREGRLQLRSEAGAVFARSTARVPSTQMFRTGGDTTVRGYGYRDIGVERANGFTAPGRYMAVGSVEWQRPIRWRDVATQWESAVFVDAGAVADRPGNLRPSVGVGVGARWKSPLGPVQVDLAYGAKAKKLRLHFTIGATF